VIDDNFAESVSLPVKIYVDTNAEDPVAAFKTKQLEGNTIEFINNSTADEENGAKIVKYIWDFDVSSDLETADSDGDGKKDNDIDSTEKEPQFTYSEPGIYRAKLIVEDNLGHKGEVINFVNVKPSSPSTESTSVSLKADFTTDPAPSSLDNAVHLSGDFGEVRFDFSKSQGDIVKYVFDNNVYVDSNGNGRKADDEDYVTSIPGVYTTTFNSEAQRIKVRLTVYDKDGNVDIKEVRIIFDQNDLGANILKITPKNSIPAIIVTIVLFGIVSLGIYLYSLRNSL
jgi:PKD repeat protein